MSTTDAPTSIGPAARVVWRATPLGAVSEAIEQRLILDMMGELAGRRVLDAGCGNGALVCAAASRGADVTGIDPDPAMLCYPPVGLLARVLTPIGCLLGGLTTFGAAFIALSAVSAGDHRKERSCR